MTKIRKAKLNTCAHCTGRTNLQMVFTEGRTPGDRKMYYICESHKYLLDLLMGRISPFLEKNPMDKE